MLFLLGAQQSSDREEAGSWDLTQPPGGEEAARQTESWGQEVAEGPLEGLQDPGRCSTLLYCPTGGQGAFWALNPSFFTSQNWGDNSVPPT